MKPSQQAAPSFVICVRNTGYAASLELLKLYPILPDARAQKLGLVRITDESGADYLYRAGYFLPVRLTAAKRKTLSKVAHRRAA